MGFGPAEADETVVQEFSGSGSTTTGLVKVPDRWEVRWNARQVVSVAVMSSDGTIVAGAAGVLRGSLFVPMGGQYYFKISDGSMPPPVIGKLSPAASTNAAPNIGTNAAPVISTNAPPVVSPSSATNSTSPPAPEPAATWHIQIVELGTSVSSNQTLSVYTPFFMVPDSVVTPVEQPSVIPPPVLTDDQILSVVTIKGDNAQGTGFLMRTSEGTFVVTHLQLLAANPNIQVVTNSGTTIKTLSLKGAIDRDLALIAVKGDHLNCLPLATNPSHGFEVDDEVIIPAIGEQTDVLSGKPGKVIGEGPERVDFDNPMGPGSSGAPVIHVKDGKVIALVTAVKRVDVSDDIAQAWPANPPPGSAGIIPFFGMRLTGIQGWQTYDMSRFLAESLFLKQFHEDTRCLDSFLNGRRHRGRSNGDGNGPPDNQYFANNLKLRAASDAYKKLANGADQGQRIEAASELLSDLQTVADTDYAALQGRDDFYAYDLAWAKEEVAYRTAIKKELDGLSDNIGRLDNIARSH